MPKLIYSLCVIFLVLLSTCKNIPEKNNVKNGIPDTIENFDYFLQRFKTDSIFQNDRIIYPLRGYNSDDVEELTFESDTDTVLSEYYWDREKLKKYINWKFEGTEYIIKIEKSDTIVDERVYIEGSGFDVTSRYKLKDHKWYLAFYFFRNE